jgi:subtilase family serine protease
MHKRRIFAVAVTAATVLAAAVAVAPSASAAPKLTAVPNSKPLWTANAKHLGSARGAAKIHARVYLSPQGGLGAVRKAAIAMSTPGTASYHHFLTPAQYRARFGTTKATVTAVSAYLKSAGLKIRRVGANNRYLVVHGTVRAAERAFSTQIDRYKHHGLIVKAPTSLVKVPAGLAASVLAVTGLDTTPRVVKPSGSNIPPPDGFRNARPCSSYYGQIPAVTKADGTTPLPKFHGERLPYAICGYTGTQFRSAYEHNSALDGTGVEVAITDAYAAPTIAFDAKHYAVLHGDRPYAAGQLVQTLPGHFKHDGNGQCGANGWWGEETLDVEAVHAMAQGATVHYYASASCYDADFLDTLARVVDDGTAKLVTNSWSDVEANENPDTTAAYEEIFLQGATEGISFMFSSGDNGDEVAATGTKQADYPASDPYATAVGGTATGIDQNGDLQFSTGWGTYKYTLAPDGSSWNLLGFLYGGGGGVSGLFDQPQYQAGVTGHPGGRAVPDVALDADPTTGMLVGQTQQFPHGVVTYDEYRIGGTSLASPLFAGMTALSVQHQGGTGAGLLNPVIYSHQGAFTDVKGSPPDAGNVRADFVNGVDASDGIIYSVRTFNQDSSLDVTPDYDLVTGLGVPNTGWLTAIS